jgi:CheY-like chemotaxis protein
MNQLSKGKTSMPKNKLLSQKKQKTVLIIEDSPVQALSLVHLLEAEGPRSFWAQNAETGISLAEEQSPDLIILDIELPAMSGLEACYLLKQNARTKDIPIILLTSHDELSFVNDGLGKGAVDFIPKDLFSDAILIKSMRQLGIIE